MLAKVARILKTKSADCIGGLTSSRLYHLSSTNSGKDVSYLSEPQYWDGFYAKNSSPFDWLVTYDGVKDHLQHMLQPKEKQYKRLLDLGCGSSTLGANIMKHLLPNAQGVFYDISQPSLSIQSTIHNIANIKARCHYVQGNVTSLPFQSDSFDMVIDKGTMDSLFKAKEKGEASAVNMFFQLITVLSPEGLYLQISDEDPETRLDFFVKYWQQGRVNFKTMEINNREIFMYTLHKS